MRGSKFTPTANFNGSGNFTVQASTSNGDAGLGGSTVVATITVNAVNDAPVLDNTKSPALTAQNEDSGAPSGAVGTLVSALVDFASPAGQVDNVSDVDSGALLGIAVTAADTTNGAWWYSTDNGANLERPGSGRQQQRAAAGGRCQYAALLPAECQLQRHPGHRHHLPGLGPDQRQRRHAGRHHQQRRYDGLLHRHRHRQPDWSMRSTTPPCWITPRARR